MELFLINPKSLPLEDKMKIAGALPDQLSISDIAKICYPDDLNARNLLSKEIIALCKSKKPLPYYGDINGWEWGSVLYDDSMVAVGLSKNLFPEIIGTPITSGDSIRDLKFNGNKHRATPQDCLIQKDDFRKYLDGVNQLPVGFLSNWFIPVEQQSETEANAGDESHAVKKPNEREVMAWLRETWINEGKLGGTAFFNKLKKYENKKGSPIVEHYSAGKDAGFRWETSSGTTGKMARKTISNKVSLFNNKP